MFLILMHAVLVTVTRPVGALPGLHHCVFRWVHYTGTVGHPGYWRHVLFCPPAHHIMPPRK